MTKKKNTTMKKLVPAAGMLALSATMLATSTYAWFTMSREVEVNNIKLTATVPADMQISLGMLNGITLGEGHGLGDNYGTLAFAGTSADNGGVTTPDDTAEYWSNIADISAYYAMGKIMPASSTNGSKIFFTPDAAGVGKTLKSGARYYTAVDGATVSNDAASHSRETTLHAFTATEKTGATFAADTELWAKKPSESGGYKAATGWDNTNDDGYFVDIPVWIRTSCKDAGGIPLSVDAYVTSNAKNDNDDLYLAARAVILTNGSATKDTTTGLLEIKPDTFDTTSTIVNFMSSTNSAGEAVKTVTTEGGTVGTGAVTYNTDTHYDGDADVVTVAAAPADETYGAPTQVWIRVWLEGEDPNCWNENAGQDFNICLKFSRDRLYNADAAQTASVTANYPTAITQLVNTAGSSAAADATALQVGDTVKLTGTAGALTYTYDGNVWKRGSESFNVPAAGTEHKATIAGTEVTFSTNDELATHLKNYVNTKEKAIAATTTPITVAASNLAKPTKIVATVASKAATYSTVNNEINSGATSYTVNGKTYASNEIEDMKTYIAGLADGNYIIDIVWP